MKARSSISYRTDSIDMMDIKMLIVLILIEVDGQGGEKLLVSENVGDTIINAFDVNS